MHLFLTGTPGVGKSTLIQHVLQETGVTTAGFYTKKVVQAEGCERVFLYSAAPEHSKDAPVCCAEKLSGGTWKAFPTAFDAAGAAALQNIPKDRIIIMDELGRLETHAKVFCNAVLSCISGTQQVLGVIKPNAETAFLQSIYEHQHVRIIEVTETNRDELLPELIAFTTRCNGCR